LAFTSLRPHIGNIGNDALGARVDTQEEPADILSEDTERQELDAAEEQGRHDQRRPANRQSGILNALNGENERQYEAHEGREQP